MYNPTTSSSNVTFNDSLDTKYTVAELLSSLASGVPTGLTPTSQYPSSMPNYTSESSTAHTGTTPLLTPSTLANIEQTFIELQNVPAQDHSRHSGFVPPVVTTASYNPNMVAQIKQEYAGTNSDYYTDDSSQDDPDWNPAKKARLSPGGSGLTVAPRPPGRRTGPRGRRSDEELTHDELEKRQVRRERNKVAAAKCRQRRVDLTNKLSEETDGLESEKQKLESEIQALQGQKEQLEFLLQAHTPVCGVKEKLAAAASTTLSNSIAAIGSALDIATSLGMSTSMPVSSTMPRSTANNHYSVAFSRPTTLNIPTSHTTSRSLPQVTVSEAIGVPITTPSNGVFTFGLDSMMDGHTGLTPITGAPSCASEVQRSHSDGSGSSPSEALASPTTLMAL